MLCGNKRGNKLVENAQYWIDHLELSPHPEGGFYRATYKADLTIAGSALPSTFGGNRAASTAIYFLLEGEDFSAFHRIAADEVWHFYAGNSLVVHVIDAKGNASELHLGSDAGFQAVVKAGCWFASRLKEPTGLRLWVARWRRGSSLRILSWPRDLSLFVNIRLTENLLKS
jgi:uncharacterized protein